MAVRDDFTAGEVLAAADLNDTFASKLPYSYGTATPSTTDSGFLWYDSNTTPPMPKYWNGSAFAPLGGLVLITGSSETAASSVTFNDCFSSTFDNYVLMFSGSAASGNPAIHLRWRVSGTDASGSDYVRQGIVADTTSLSAFSGTQTVAEAGVLDTSGNTNIVYVSQVNKAAHTTTMTSLTDTGGGGRRVVIFGTGHGVSTAYTGFTFLTSSSTFTGNIAVYGVRK